MQNKLSQVIDSELDSEKLAGLRGGRLILEYFGRFCHIDLYGGYHRIERNNTMKNNNQQQIPLAQIRRQFDWPGVLRMLYVVSITRMSMNVYYQYYYDYRLYYLQQQYHSYESMIRIISGFEASTNGTPSLSSELEKFNMPIDHMHVIRELEQAKSNLISIGAPFLEATFTIECFTIFLLVISLLVYVQTQVYFNFIQPFNYSVIRSILNWKMERRIMNEMVEMEVNKFIMSSFNYCRVCISQLQLFTGRCPVILDRPGYNRNERDRSIIVKKLQDKMDTLRQRHWDNVRRLNKFVAEGKLMPRNRTADWMTKVAHYYCLFTALSVIYILMFASTCLIALPMMFNFNFRLHLMDILAMVEIFVVIVIIIVSAVFYISLILTNCVDQSKLIIEIRKRIDKFIDTNYVHKTENEPDQYYDQDYHFTMPTIGKLERPKHEAKIELIKRVAIKRLMIGPDWRRMNDDLFKIVLEYKIFVAQLKSIKRTFGFLATTSLFVALLMPLIARLHVPYVENNIRMLSIAVSLVCLTFSDMCMVPICYLYSRCLDLYVSLSRLLAHVIDDPNYDGRLMHPSALLSSSPFSTTASRPLIYDEHLIWIIRKELNHPDRLRGQFATVGMGILFTYANLIRIHFWFGLIVLSLLVETNPTDGEFLSGLFNDPLGVLQQK